jgi:hypothetical protein
MDCVETRVKISTGRTGRTSYGLDYVAQLVVIRSHVIDPWHARPSFIYYLLYHGMHDNERGKGGRKLDAHDAAHIDFICCCYFFTQSLIWDCVVLLTRRRSNDDVS